MPEGSVFPEFSAQADYVDIGLLPDINYDNEFYLDVRRSLTERGPKLLVGPRGVGKTHQMRLALVECKRDNDKPFAVYASFNQYFHLEPLTKKSPNARKVFHMWMLCHIIDAVQKSCELFELSPEFNVYSILNVREEDVLEYKSLAQKGEEPDTSHVRSSINIDTVVSLIRKAYTTANRRRAVILLDDAAMSLANEYLFEFFEVFQALKHTDISPKASVYPGSTQYGPKFHARHDAGYIDAWLNVEDPSYKETLRGILASQLKLSSIPQDDIDLLAYASFGVPRSFLNMLLSYHNISRQKINKANAVIEEQAALITKEFESLGLKMPQFKTVIQSGKNLSNAMVAALVEENEKLREGTEKQVLIGLTRDDDLAKPMIERMLNLMQEAGIIYGRHPVKHGDGREYDRYIPHYALLIRSRAFAFSRGTSHRNTVAFIERKNEKHPLRRKIRSLLPGNLVDSITPDLPPCQNCGTSRLSEDQKFCHNCGKPLINKSVFESLLNMPVDQLPLTDFLKKKMKDETQLRKISDFISLQDPASDLRQAHGIGPKRSERIVSVVNGYITDFLG